MCRADSPVLLEYGRNLSYVNQAWNLATDQVPSAIVRQAGADFAEVIRSIVPAMLITVGGLFATTAAGAAVGAAGGALVGGVGAAPGAVLGGEAGLSIGLWLLEWLGLAFLAVYIGEALAEISRAFTSGIDTAWRSCGDRARIDAAAMDMANGVGRFCSLLLQGIAAYAAKDGVAVASKRLAESRLGRGMAAFIQSDAFWEAMVSWWLRKLGKEGAPPLVRKNLRHALEFFDKRMKGLPLETKKSFLDAMDLHEKAIPVEEITLTAKKGELLVAFRPPAQDPLRLFYTRAGTSPYKLGIDPEGYKPVYFKLKGDVRVLRSRTTGVKAYNSGAIVDAGGEQFIIPNASQYLEVERVGAREPLGPAVRKVEPK